MGALMYRCPTTSQHVKTAIDTEPAVLARMRNIKISVSCPHCIEGHRIPASEMYFEGLPSWPAAALSQFEIALNLASSNAAQCKQEAEKWFKLAIERDAAEGGKGGNAQGLISSEKPREQTVDSSGAPERVCTSGDA
jgi:hypothetical protein